MATTVPSLGSTSFRCRSGHRFMTRVNVTRAGEAVDLSATNLMESSTTTMEDATATMEQA